MKTKLVLIAVAVVLLMGEDTCFTDEATAKRVLEENGYTNVQLTGYEAFMCGKDDTYSDGFTATAPGSGRQVKGVVCSGWNKGATIRFK